MSRMYCTCGLRSRHGLLAMQPNDCRPLFTIAVSPINRLNEELMKLFSKALAFVAMACSVSAAEPSSLAPGVRGLATRAPKGMKIDGDLSEFKGAFCTPIEYFNEKLRDRAAQFLYMWDEEAFYAGLRTLDTKPANPAPDNQLWEGDAVEWNFDTRSVDAFRSQ